MVMLGKHCGLVGVIHSISRVKGVKTELQVRWCIGRFSISFRVIFYTTDRLVMVRYLETSSLLREGIVVTG